MTTTPTVQVPAQVLERAAERRALCQRVKESLIECLDLTVDADWMTDDQPLFGRGLELDSIDGLEIAVTMEYDFGVTVTDDRVDVFGSVNRMVDYIVAEGGALTFDDDLERAEWEL